MRRCFVSSIVVMMSIWLMHGALLAQAPTAAEAQAVWNAFWDRVAAGDLDGARRYVHTTRQGFPWMVTGAQLQERARQMQRCRLGADPLPGSAEDVLFEVRCEHAGQTAATLVGFRQDLDGTWRLTVL